MVSCTCVPRACCWREKSGRHCYCSSDWRLHLAASFSSSWSLRLHSAAVGRHVGLLLRGYSCVPAGRPSLEQSQTLQSRRGQECCASWSMLWYGYGPPRCSADMSKAYGRQREPKPGRSHWPSEKLFNQTSQSRLLGFPRVEAMTSPAVVAEPFESPDVSPFVAVQLRPMYVE